MPRKKRINVDKPAVMAGTVKKPSYEQFMKGRISQWVEIRAIGVGLVEFARRMGNITYHDDSRTLLHSLEQAGITIQELSDVEIVPMILATWQPRMFDDPQGIPPTYEDDGEEKERQRLEAEYETRGIDEMRKPADGEKFPF